MAESNKALGNNHQRLIFKSNNNDNINMALNIKRSLLKK